MTCPAVFLDRDGVVNDAIVRDGKPFPPSSVNELRIGTDVEAALAALKRGGYMLVIVTNQPDVARGTQAREAVEAIHARLKSALPIDAIYSCFHDDADRCPCRKPAPGLLRIAAAELAIDLARSFMVGDRWRDTDAGVAAGCRTIFIDRDYSEKKPQAFDVRVHSLTEAAAWILRGVN